MTQPDPPNPVPSLSGPAGSQSPTSFTYAVHGVAGSTPHGAAQPQLTMQIQTTAQMQAQGMFPSPAIIKEYELILPGTFERIVRMAEKAQADQIDTIRFAQSAQARDTLRVHWMAIGVSALAMIGAAFCAYIKQPVVAGLFLGVPVFAVAKAFIDSLRAPSAAQQGQRQPQQQQQELVQQILQQLEVRAKSEGGK